MVGPRQIGIDVAKAGDPVEHPVAFELDAELRAFVLRRHDHYFARRDIFAVLAFLALERDHVIAGGSEPDCSRTSGGARSNDDYVSVAAHWFLLESHRMPELLGYRLGQAWK